MTSSRSALADLPRIDDLLDAAGDLVDRYGRGSATRALRDAVGRARARLQRGELTGAPDVAALLGDAAADLAVRRPGPPRRVINATGVVLHTNLGRAPLSDDARAAVDAASGYCDVELDLASGARGSRSARLDPLLADATGAAAGLAVNNAAAALVLTLATLATGRQVLVSRGELVEIGGSFRLPEIMGASGAQLVEVGTTNRTRAADFATAGDDVAAILSVHPSNYRVTGFVEQPELGSLAAVAADRGVPLLHDVGSGVLAATGDPWLDDEPTVAGSLAAGADLVLCSGDKLLGGPQAGLLVGDADLVRRCARHPLTRALRLDKLRIAALVATLEAHLRDAPEEVPAWGLLRADPDVLRERATALATAAGGSVVDGASLVGGGAVPDRAVPGPVVRVDRPAPERAAAALRHGDPPIVVRVADDALWADPRTVDPRDDELVGARLAAAVGASPSP